MLPASRVAAHAFAISTGGGAEENLTAAMPPAEFLARVQSGFNAAPRAVTTVRSFQFKEQPLSVTVNTDGRRPSAVTIRTLRATIKTLTHLYGRCPHTHLTLYLVEDPTPKTLPRSGHVSTAHVNSGFSQGATVVVFRCSEMHRTLVHEMVHVWRAHSLDLPAAQAAATRDLGAPSGCLITEAFVEAVTWLVHGGFCNGGLHPEHALRAARAYLRVADDGRTNGWAYFVGKALLVADGGRAFSGAFFSGGRGRRLDSARAFADILGLMRGAQATLGGRGLPLAPEPGNVSVRMCNCGLGPAFSSG